MLTPHAAGGKVPPGDEVPKHFHAGTLVYTKAGLFTLFTWLLWGDFAFTLMEAVWGQILPLELHSLNAPNILLALVTLTIPQVISFVLNPIVSTMSDRYRGPRGRRIPFLMFATPFVALFLVLMSFSRQIGAFLHELLKSGGLSWLDANSVTIGVIFVLVLGFRLFELFINTIYWYLFNDVVPAVLLGRFLGLFRVVGAVAGALFNFFVLRFAESHASWIFLGAGVLYGVVFFLMCLNVKEGEYPPPDPMTAGSKSPWAYLKTYGKECFSHRMFILVFLSGAIWSLANLSVGPFTIFWALSLGLTLDQVGKITAVSMVVTGILSYPAGVLVDRIHPIRVQLIAKVGICILAPVKLVYLFFDFSPSVVFWIYITITALAVPLGAIYTAAGLPMMMRTLPHERFGQFSSADAMVRAVAVIIGSLLAGCLLDFVKSFYPGSEFYYRYIPFWTIVFCTCSLIATWLLFKEWKKLGGDKHYRPPCPDKLEDLYQPDP